MSKSTNLGLELTGTSSADTSQSFLTWRQKINGESSDSNMNIIDSAVGDLKSAFDVSASKNIYNPDALISGYYVNPTTGATVESSGASATDFVPIDDDVTLSANANIGNFTTVRYAFYDSSKTYISGSTFTITSGGSSISGRYAGTATAPNNAAYIRVSMATSVWTGLYEIQIEIGSTNTAYEPHGKTVMLKDASLPSDIIGLPDDVSGLEASKVDKNGTNQVMRTNIEGVSIGNWFAFGELDKAYHYATATGANQSISYFESTTFNCYLVPVKKNTAYTITHARFLILLDDNMKSLAAAEANVTYFNSGNATMISISFDPATYPPEQFKICESGVDTVDAYIYPDWLHPVKPVTKTDAMTIPVGVDSDGKLFAEKQILTPKKYKSLYADGNLSSGDYLIFTKETALKKGESLLFSCNITSFDKLIVGWSRSTPGEQKYPYCEITTTSIIVHGTNANGPAAPTLTHGLTIAVNLQFRMTIKHDSIDVELISNGERYVGTEQVFKGNQGYGFAMSDGSVLTDCHLSWCGSDIDKIIWMFGDSYFGLTNPSRWLYYLQSDGYANNALLDAYAGRNSANALLSLNSLITLEKPDYIVWCLGMNDGSDTNASTPTTAWTTGRDAVLSICESYGIIPVFATIPNVPTINHTGKNAWIKASGYRYIDFAQAVGASESGSSWYTGMLSSDNVHPTDKGAKALYGQFVADFPEITIP